MKLIKMHYTNPVSWLFMPQLLDRASRFADKYNLDLNPGLTHEAIRTNFVVRNPLIMSWVAVDGSKVKGHIVTSIDSLNDYTGVKIKRYLTILQAECSCLDQEMRNEVMSALKTFAKVTDCDDIQLLAEGPARVKLFEDRYGFKPNKTVMKLGGL